MKFLIITLLVAYAAADVSHLAKPDESKAEIRRQEFDVGVEGQYQYGYETENGISAREQGSLKSLGPEETAEVVQGEAQWTSPEGEKVQFAYVADENGYQPQGSHLPTPHPIPEAIARSLEYIRAHPPPPSRR